MKFQIGRARASRLTKSQTPVVGKVDFKEKNACSRARKTTGIGASDYIPIDSLPKAKTFPSYSPWVSPSTLQLERNPLLQLHQEMIDFVEFLRPTEPDATARQTAFQEIRTILLELWPNAQIALFGSSENGLFLPNSDIDISVLFPGEEKSTDAVERLEIFKTFFSEKTAGKYDSELIKNARVPIIRISMVCGKFCVDISINAEEGRKGGLFIKQLMEKIPEAKYLVLVVKSLLRQRGLNDTYTGGVGSFLLYHLVVFSLQTHPAYTTDQDHYTQYSLGHYLMHFLKFYGEIFDYEKCGISVEKACTFDRKTNGWESKIFLVLECPLDSKFNLACGAFRMGLVKRTFSHCYSLLCAQVHRSLKTTPLSCILRPMLT